ncbi:MAG TPA: hypothetical protein VG125_29560 [Pirellulales bacterium]|jgi:hypothetical protein|nr:hypothetical protein [Pirellulales bacterium]
MANIIAQPRQPVQDWEATVEAWVSEVDSLIGQASQWSQSRGWGTKIDSKTVSEEMIGTYEVPRLLVHSPDARFLLDPIARFIVGGGGRIDLCVIPSYDGVPLVKTDQGWKFFPRSKDGQPLDWSEESFARICGDLVKLQ